MKQNSQAHKLKPEQATAAHTLDQHLSVSAGPGAGKTKVLVERYLHILRTQKVSVDNVVAITFTNRAANEMRERVRGEIDSLLRSTAGAERQRWLRHKRALEGAVITTIHGFCSRVLHEFPVEANIDPQFVLLDEQQATLMLEAVVDEALSNAIHHGNEQVVKLTQGIGGRGTLAALLAELYRKYRGEGLALADIKARAAASHATMSDYAAAFAELDTRMNELLQSRLKTLASRNKQSKLRAEWPRVRALVAQPPSEKSIAQYCQAIEDFREIRPAKNVISQIVAIDDLLWGDDTNDRLAGRLPRIGFDLRAKDYSLAVLTLMQDIERRLDEEKQRLSVLDFDDLQLRTLKLLDEHPQLFARISERYRFFLVDEFQDTNGLQRDLMMKLGLRRGANLFIVGDRKQSIYGFRGADVDVFGEMTKAIENAGGLQQPLHLNFRSQKPLIDTLNFVFGKVFRAPGEVNSIELGELGYVPHEDSVAERAARDWPPLVEFLVSVVPESKYPKPDSEEEEETKYESRSVRERDAAQLIERIEELVTGAQASRLQTSGATASDSKRDACAPVNYDQIAVLFRALTGVGVYESALRRAGIPYLTVQGKGFYQREEVTDLIQLLRFLDNSTDEIALAAILRSPLCGISDNTLFALRSAPFVGEATDGKKLPRRNLWRAVQQHREIQFIDAEEHTELDRVAAFLGEMIERRNRYSIADLLRHAVTSTDFTSVIAANFDGAHRISNVEKLFRLAEAFEKSGQLIRDFVHYVEKFEEAGGRETEGQIDKTANVVRLMTIHQAKGLEFPVVIIPDVHRYKSSEHDNSLFVLDRHQGFTVAVPDGRGTVARGTAFSRLRERGAWRERFESMRLLYVAATRAEDRLIFSGATTQNDLKNLQTTTRDQWLAWLWQALELNESPETGIVKFGDDVQVALRVGREISHRDLAQVADAESPSVSIDLSQPLARTFPLLRPVAVERGATLRRFTVTQLLNFQRCARQYYFDRLLHAPGAEELSVWNDAEAPEPPANLTATLKGAVIHRFCEIFCEGDEVNARLRESFAHVRALRIAQLAGRPLQVDTDAAISDLLPLAQNYLQSDVFRRVQSAQSVAPTSVGEVAGADHRLKSVPPKSPGLWSELRFRLRRPLGTLTGTIDKLLITPSADGIDVEIIDFKTNRFPRASGRSSRPRAVTMASTSAARSSTTAPRGQAAFDFETASEPAPMVTELVTDESVDAQIENAVRDYRLQMQAYALAFRELVPRDVHINSLRVTLHFIQPNVEKTLDVALLEREACAHAVDEAMSQVIALDGTIDAEDFPALTNAHCRTCGFLEFCSPGQDWQKIQNRER
ncbi:MAG TPA: UvrD-helicase domain-containing protein [Pyrinomonadaceae bacterium]|nr:UvrD-helicase domain-containing protein [Pyrinomonadaceae bacterium]